jgi:hypothetical protein
LLWRFELSSDGGKVAFDYGKSVAPLNAQKPWVTYKRESRPTLIVGHPRSGSSLLVRALLNCSRRGYSEGHIFPLMILLSDETANYYNSVRGFSFNRDIALARLPLEVVQSRIVDIFEEFMIQSLGTCEWFDKTVNVETIRGIPLLKQIWPDAKFVFTYRTAEEAVHSAMDHFGRESELIASCSHWARCLSAWKDVRPFLGRQGFELEHGKLLEDDAPELIRNLAEFLGLDATDRDIFEKFYAKEIATWAPVRKTYSSSLFDKSEIRESDRLFFSICQGMMREYGFWSDEAVSDMRARGLEDHVFVYSKSAVKAERRNLDHAEDFHEIPGGFLLHPAAGDQPASVTYHDIILNGHVRFCSQIVLENQKASSPVRFEVQISIAKTGQVVGSTNMTLVPGGCAELELEIPEWARNDTVDVAFSTERTDLSQKNYYCWAHWYVPRLTAR